LYQRSALPNGLRILSSTMAHTRSVSVGIFVGAGSRYEQESVAGASHFLEHMLFKGTERRPEPAMISGAIESVGGVINAYTDRELTLYWTKVAVDHFSLAVDLLADMVLRSTMAEREVERERMVILEELAMTNDQPDARADLLIDETLWPDQPMGRDVGGSKETVSGISRSDLVAYHRQQYVANNMVVSVAGDVTHQQVVDIANEHMGGWAPGTPRDWFPVKQPVLGNQVTLEKRRTDQAHICLAFPGVSSTDPKRFALDLLNTVLGEGMTSRLFLEVRERQGLAYDVHSSSSHYRDCGGVVIYCSVDPAKVNVAVSAILSELTRLREGVTADELRRAVEFTTGRFLLRMEDTRAVMSSMGGQEMLVDQVRTPDEVVQEVRRITPEQVREAAETYVVPGAYKLAVVGPYRSDARFRRLLSA
jgi:predicted Zn-dependent peptidase